MINTQKTTHNSYLDEKEIYTEFYIQGNKIYDMSNTHYYII